MTTVSRPEDDFPGRGFGARIAARREESRCPCRDNDARPACLAAGDPEELKHAVACARGLREALDRLPHEMAARVLAAMPFSMPTVQVFDEPEFTCRRVPSPISRPVRRCRSSPPCRPTSRWNLRELPKSERDRLLASKWATRETLTLLLAYPLETQLGVS